MRVIFRFEKGETVRYVSHLDMLRAMQRTLGRSGLPVAYSQGFHPHMLVTFAMPLPVGATSQGEYMDVVFREGPGVEEIAGRLAEALPPGWTVTGVHTVADSAPALMAMTAQCDWQIDFPGMEAEALGARVASLMASSQVLVTKTSPKGPPKEINIRDGILTLKTAAVPDGARVWARLAAGSQLNIGPGLLVDALAPGIDARRLLLHRLELYGLWEGNPLPLLELAACY